MVVLLRRVETGAKTPLGPILSWFEFQIISLSRLFRAIETRIYRLFHVTDHVVVVAGESHHFTLVSRDIWHVSMILTGLIIFRMLELMMMMWLVFKQYVQYLLHLGLHLICGGGFDRRASRAILQHWMWMWCCGMCDPLTVICRVVRNQQPCGMLAPLFLACSKPQTSQSQSLLKVEVIREGFIVDNDWVVSGSA